MARRSTVTVVLSEGEREAVVAHVGERAGGVSAWIRELVLDEVGAASSPRTGSPSEPRVVPLEEDDF